MNEKEAKIDALIKRAAEARLEGLDFLAAFGYGVLCREYNGIGPEWVGADIRELVTRHAAIFEPAALIHDMRNYMSDGTEAAFHHANGEFLLNCLKLAKQTYPWWRPRRYAAIAAANAMFDFVEGPGGWKAWLEAHERFVNKQNKDKNQ